MADTVDFTTRKRSVVKPPADILAEAEIDNLVQMSVLNAKMVEEALGTARAPRTSARVRLMRRLRCRP
jgi:hypothetical protein